MNILKLVAEGTEDLLNASAYGAGALIRVESSTDDVTFAEIGTVALVSGTYAYTYYDQTGASGAYYRTRYSNSANTNDSDYSPTFRATQVIAEICSLYDVKAALGIKATDTKDDEELLQYIDRTATMIRARTSQDFLQDPLSGTTIRYYDGLKSLDGNRLYIQGGFQRIDLVEIAIFTGGTYYTLPSSVYFARPHTYESRPGWPYLWLQMTDYTLISTTAPIFYPGTDNIRLTGVFGWAQVPSDIEGVAIRATVNAWRRRSAGSAGDAFQLGEDGSRTFSALLSSEDRRILRMYSQEALVVA